ncbi:multisubunit Na+/H+ antiporter MnhG subunit [Parabacteroides sp. PFB2-10]|uniref:immunity 17 family protein n=1 Tax=Parabacteroides sp. PFB2-10 TaxID=1742405 RepID=UPI002473669C|nr:immunity 17 family protein [Parabacteroides sp. PFB2-10]MDH6312773.1 multisubunit Na+/H+ antiporter MnhG subunit [Parabacteroides sp. PFB2-10]
MTIPEYILLALFLLMGVFTCLASLLNFNWFFEARKARTVVGTLGRTGARVFYFCLGIALIACSVMGYLQWSASTAIPS